MSPFALFPLADGGRVLLTGLSLGLLATPAHALEHAPDIVGSELNVELALNDLGNAFLGPQFRRIAALLSAFQKQVCQFLLLLVA